MKIGIFENKIGEINKIKDIYIEKNENLYKILYSITTKNNNNCNTILIYNPENPLVGEREKEEIIKTTNGYDLVFAVIKVRDTIKKVDNNCFIKETLDRKNFRQIQAEAIKYSSLKKLLENCIYTDNFILSNGNGLKEKIIELI